MRYNKRIWKRLLFGIIFSIFLMKGIDSEWNNSVETAMFYENEESSDGRKEFIKWVDFKVTAEAMNQAYQYDRDSVWW